MKKVFLPIIAAAMYLAASATPATFNYQGVCDYKNAKNVEVVFTLTNSDGTQSHTWGVYVETNANGMFTTEIGDDTLGAYDFENDTWTLTTTVGGVSTTCKINAVPYALNAKGLNEVSSDVQGIREELRGKANVDQVYDLTGAVEELQEAVKAMNDIEGDGLGAWTAQQIGTLYEGLGVVEDDVRDLVMANRENKTDIAELKVWQEGVNGELENAYMTGQVAQTAYDMADKNADDIAVLQEGLGVVEDDVRDLVMANRENKTDIAELKVWQEGVNGELENAYMTGQVAQTAYDMADKNADDIAILQDDVIGLTEKTAAVPTIMADLEATTNLAQSLSEDLYKEGGIVDHVVALDELDLPNVVENLEMMTPMLQEMEENITALQEGADVLSTDVAELVQANRENKTDIAELKVWQEGVNGELENAYMTGQVAQTAYDMADKNADAIAELQKGLTDNVETGNNQALAIKKVQEDLALVKVDAQATSVQVATLEEGLNTTQQDVMDLSLANRENATAIADLQALNLPNVLENLDMLVPQIETMHEDIAALQDGLTNTQDDVQGLVEDNMSNKAAIADLQSLNLPNVLENLDMLVPQIETMHEAIDTLQEGLGVVEDDLRDLVLDNIANKTAIAQNAQDIEALKGTQAQVDNLAEVLQEIMAEDGTLTTTLNANTADIAKAQAQIDNLAEVIQDIVAEDGQLTTTLNSLTEGLDVVSNDLNEMVMANRENKTDIAELKARIDALTITVQTLHGMVIGGNN